MSGKSRFGRAKRATPLTVIESGTEYYQRTCRMRRCGGVVPLYRWDLKAERGKRGQVHVRDVVWSRVIWDSKTLGTFPPPEKPGEKPHAGSEQA